MAVHNVRFSPDDIEISNGILLGPEIWKSTRQDLLNTGQIDKIATFLDYTGWDMNQLERLQRNESLNSWIITT
jgi:putative AlgH/UPF0301 family transcriptional regulator